MIQETLLPYLGQKACPYMTFLGLYLFPAQSFESVIQTVMIPPLIIDSVKPNTQPNRRGYIYIRKYPLAHNLPYLRCE